MVQCYSTVNSNVSSHEGTLAPQSKRQMDRFSRFCAAYGTKCLHFTMGTPMPQNCSLPWGIWTSHVTHDALGPCEPTTETAPRSVQPCLYRWPQSVPIWFACFAIKLLFHPMLASGLHVIHDSLGPPAPPILLVRLMAPFLQILLIDWVRNANGNLILSAVFAGLTSVTDWQSDRQTDRPRYSVQGSIIMRNYVGYGKATQSFHVSTNNFATIKSLSVRSKHLIKYLV